MPDEASPRGAARATLLIVDDEPHILSAMRRTLRREGYDLLLAEGPTAALAWLAERSVDLVLSDQMMPVMRGTELLEEVARRQPRAARMLITGWTDDVGGEDLERIGISTPLTKPWEDAELKEALRKALAQVVRE
ncbi:MAG: response regulator [bacterium]|nr:response regulator [bacterium]